MKFLLADDHPMVRMGIKMMLKRLYPQAEVFEARDYCEALELCGQHTDFSLIMLDRIMPGMEGLEGQKSLHKLAPDVPIVILSASDDPAHVWQSLDHGARGYIPKSSSEDVMCNALQLVLSGSTYLPPALLGRSRSETINHESPPAVSAIKNRAEDLTRRQREVLVLVVKGKSNKQIAGLLDISEATVHTHLNSIFRLLGVSNRTEAVHVIAGLDLALP